MRWVGPIFAFACLMVVIFAVMWELSQKQQDARLSSGGKILKVRLDEAPMMGEPIPQDVPKKLVNVFASWCTPCIAELPYLAKLKAATQMPLIGIAYNDHEAKLKPWLVKYGNPFDVIFLDDKGQLLGRAGVSGVPETYLVDELNQITFRHYGPLTSENIESIIREIHEKTGGS